MNERLLQRLISSACLARDIELRVLSDGWLLEMRKDHQVHRVLGTDFGLNTQVSAAIAKDKVATSIILERAGIRHIKHELLSSHGHIVNESELESAVTHWPAVLKPLEGSHGTHVFRVDSAKQIIDIISSVESSWALSTYVDVQSEIRLVLVDGDIRLAHLKQAPVIRNGLKLFNLHAGATAVPVSADELPGEVVRLALSAMTALDLRMAAVDIVTTSSGERFVLEVNAAFSLNRFAATNERAYAMTADFYDQLSDQIFS